MLRNVNLQILTTRLIELESWVLVGLNDPFWRLYLPVAGRATVRVEVESGHVECRLRPGGAYLLPPRTTIRAANRGPFSKWYVHFVLGPGGDRATPGIFPIELSETMRATLAELPALAGAPFPWRSASLVGEALQQLPHEVWTKRQVDPRVEAAMDFMHANLKRKLTAETIARNAGLSTRNLSHLFRRHVRSSPMRVLLDFRLDEACRLLRHGDESIEQVAEECGFANRYYFSRMLKRRRGTSPAAYRRAEV